VLTTLNDSIASESTGGLFVTLSYVIFDIRRQKLFLSNGGHLPLVAAPAAGASELMTAEGGMPVGVMEGVAFSDLERAIKPGDCFAFYTDGVSEARNRKKEEYGLDALQKMVSESKHLSAQGILDNTVRDLNRFMGKADQHDDITLVIVKIEEASL
jgi:sigma-B regulation protein RsbU (phosphoserine phosphatase)